MKSLDFTCRSEQPTINEENLGNNDGSPEIQSPSEAEIFGCQLDKIYKLLNLYFIMNIMVNNKSNDFTKYYELFVFC